MESREELPENENDRLRRENKELRDKLADLETIITMMPVPIAISEDALGYEIEVNPAFAALLGVDTNARVSLGQPETHKLPFQVFRNGKPVPEAELPHPVSAKLGQTVHDELEIVRDDGLHYYIYGAARPLFDSEGKIRRTFSAFVDVTERKRAEKALEQSIQALTSANEELQQFAYAASHDLQEPLRSIASYAQLLERRYGQADKEAGEYTAFIVEGVNRMNTLIQDLLRYARLGAGTLKRTPVPLENPLQWALLNLSQSIQEQRATITHDELPEVIGDESQLASLFQNLISNSLKYKGPFPPLIHVSAEELEDEWLVSVRDNGVGIEQNYQKQIFGVFKRLHGREVPGTGIGLALGRKIVEKHGGRIWVESDGKSGSDFRFTLSK